MTKKEKEAIKRVEEMEFHDVPKDLPQIKNWIEEIKSTDVRKFPYAFNFCQKKDSGNIRAVVVKCPHCGKIMVANGCQVTNTIKCNSCGSMLSEEFVERCSCFNFSECSTFILLTSTLEKFNYNYNYSWTSKTNIQNNNKQVKPLLVIEHADEEVVSGYIWDAIYAVKFIGKYLDAIAEKYGLPNDYSKFMPEKGEEWKCQFLFDAPFEWLFYPEKVFTYLPKSGKYVSSSFCYDPNYSKVISKSSSDKMPYKEKCIIQNLLNEYKDGEKKLEVAETEAFLDFVKMTDESQFPAKSFSERFMWLKQKKSLERWESSQKKEREKNAKIRPYADCFRWGDDLAYIQQHHPIYYVESKWGEKDKYISFNGETLNEISDSVSWEKLSSNNSIINIIKWDYEKELQAAVYRNIRILGKFEGNKLVLEKHEETRIFFTKKEYQIFTMNYEGKWEKISASKAKRDNFRRKEAGAVLITSLEELRVIFENAGFLNSGILEAWGLNGSEYLLDNEKPGFLFQGISTAYIFAYYAYPSIEKILKGNLEKILKDILRGYGTGFLNLDGDDIPLHKMLGVPKKRLSFIREKDMDSYEFASYKKMLGIDMNAKNETWDAIKENDLNMTVVADIVTNHGIGIDKILNYLENVRDYQCVEPKDSLIIWRDYLDMAKEIGKEFTKNSTFPDSLKREHDKASYARRLLAEKIEKEKFTDSVKDAQRFEYKGSVYSIIAPKTPQDLIKEGESLNHCVGTYIKKVCDKERTVLFVRKNSELTKSYFTMDIISNEVIQLRGFNNEVPKSERLLEFVEDWAQKKEVTFRRNIF